MLKPKEGLALINGTQFITALGAEAIERATMLVLQADIIASLTVEVLKGNVDQFDPDIHKARPHNGQIEVFYFTKNKLIKIIFKFQHIERLLLESVVFYIQKCTNLNVL